MSIRVSKEDLIEALKPLALLAEHSVVNENHPLGYYLKLTWVRDPIGGYHDISPREIDIAAKLVRRGYE